MDSDSDSESDSETPPRLLLFETETRISCPLPAQRLRHTPHGVEADSFNNVVGIVYEKKVDLKNALVQHQKALEIQTRVFGRSKHECSDQSTRS